MFAVVVDMNNVGMEQLGQGFSFTLKTFQYFFKCGWGKLVNTNDLDGHIAFKARVEGFVDRRHAARTQFTLDRVAIGERGGKSGRSHA